MTIANTLRGAIPFLAVVLIGVGAPLSSAAEESAPGGMQLWKKIQLPEGLTGGFALPADLTGDGRIELLVSYANFYAAHLRLVAMDLDGNILWSHGDPSVTSQDFDRLETMSRGMEPPCRPAITAYDFDGNGHTEVVAEFWNDGAPRLVMLAGATGETLHEIPSPFEMDAVREPEGYAPSRPSPQALTARLDGRDKPASVVVKYEASGRIPTLAIAYDHELNKRWEVHGRPDDMGHHARVVDLTGDGRDDIVFGQLAVDSDGERIFRRDFPHHADAVDMFTIDGEKRLLVTICVDGPAYCLDANGEIIWEKTQEEVPHGQAGWAGNFIPDRPGLEAIVQVSGHYGIFHTFDAEDGEKLAEFEHLSGIKHEDGSRRYPDMPVKVQWREGEDALWIPIDRKILNGRGEVVACLGELEEQVIDDLRPGTTKEELAVQAVPVVLCGDDREELVLYQPYQAKAVYIVTQADSDGAERPYVPQENAYNRPAYF